MPESIFKQVSLDILRLHQQAIRSLIATKCCDECEVHDAVFITLDGPILCLAALVWANRPNQKPASC